MARLPPYVTTAIPHFPQQSIRRKTALSFATVVLYVFLYLLLDSVLANTTAIVSILPVMVTAWLFGLRVGLLAAVMAVLLNTLLVSLVSDRSWQEWFRQGGELGSAALVAVGAVTGSLRDLAEKARDELTRLRRTEEALQKAYDELEIRVAERTAKLSTTNEILAYETVQRKQAEDIQQQLATAMNNSIDGIALVNDKGQFVQVNDALAQNAWLRPSRGASGQFMDGALRRGRKEQI